MAMSEDEAIPPAPSDTDGTDANLGKGVYRNDNSVFHSIPSKIRFFNQFYTYTDGGAGNESCLTKSESVLK